MHDQAEDRCHRIGQRDAVTAWYLLAANTIDETMARLIQRKRAIVAAATDGRAPDDGRLVEGVARELREGRPFTHLRAVGRHPARCRPHRTHPPAPRTCTPRAATSRGSTTTGSRSCVTWCPPRTLTPRCAARTSAA